ncbi:MAG: alpha-amylase [Chloroflexi bacterium]|nr:alpha-amylase [Chloroflexota bacterium]MBP8056147.1 alpha-amylase [Chloroflexota bacterium]
MALDTPFSTRNLVIYEIYVRNHTRNGTLAEVIADLPRIREMGVDVVWFMPIHPIGELKRKGTWGSPYAIQDYRAVNPEYGTQDGFKMLCEYAHALGLKVMIDVVYNHTSPDSLLVANHPEWYHQDAAGQPMTTVPDWSDVIDLNYTDPALEDYLVETLKHWVALGVDGFRCDVASVVPLRFWQRARAEIAQIKPGVLWLSESVHTSFIIHRRRHGLSGWSDGEIHTAFDLSYDYDLWPLYEKAMADPTFVPWYIAALWFQKGIYPAHTVKMRCVENHDQLRIMKRAPSRDQALAWTAFQAFNEGAFLIYAGQESENSHTPSLFELDKVVWGDYSLQAFLTRLCQLKKDPIQVEGQFTLLRAEPAITALWQGKENGLFGVFNVGGVVDVAAAPLPDGVYPDELTGQWVTVRDGAVAIPDAAAILRYTGTLNPEPHIQPFPFL